MAKYKEVNSGQVVEVKDTDTKWIEWFESQARWVKTDEPATNFNESTKATGSKETNKTDVTSKADDNNSGKTTVRARRTRTRKTTTGTTEK